MFDGVLAWFDRPYSQLLIKTSGRNLYPQESGAWGSPSWDFDIDVGYTPAEIDAAWGFIERQPDWWEKLSPLNGAETLSSCIFDLESRHDIYFVTARRSGLRVKQQTENWLRNYVGLAHPTVLMSGDKDLVAEVLRLDAYIDDNLPNAVAVAGNVKLHADLAVRCNVKPKFNTKVFLLDKAYNQSTHIDGVIRVGSVGQMLDYLILDL